MKKANRTTLISAGAALFLLLIVTAGVLAADANQIDWRKVQLFRAKRRAGLKLSAEETAYLKRAMKVRQQQREAGQKGKNKRPPMTPKTKTGLVPLTDMKASDLYKGHHGGLYGKGRNVPPARHALAAMGELEKIQPLDADGKPSPDGKVVMVSIGMSNTNQAFGQFISQSAKLKNLSEHLVIVNCARGGVDVTGWLGDKPLKRFGGKTIWQLVEKKLADAGVTPAQVQVAWVKHAKATPKRDGEFPAHAEILSQNIGKTLIDARKHLPNLRIAYISSRTYAGYAAGQLNPEPYAYESGFAVQWLIERQIAGDEKLNFDPAAGKVNAPLLLWGPYLWADGIAGRKTDKLVYKREDFAKDGTHPSRPIGQEKVGKLLVEFFSTDPLARGWFLTPVQ